MKWFKIIIGSDGKIESCYEVPAFDKNGKTVRFVEAETEIGARAIVLAWQREGERRRERQRVERERLRTIGFCAKCKKVPAVPGRAMCEPCREYHRQYALDYHHGRIKPRPVKTEAEQVQNFAEKRSARIKRFAENNPSNYSIAQMVTRRDLLGEVRRKMEDMTAAVFRAWVVEEHEKAVAARPPGKKAAWREVAERVESDERTEPGDFPDTVAEEIAKVMAAPRSSPRATEKQRGAA